MPGSASGGDVTTDFRRCLNSESFRKKPLRFPKLLLSLHSGRITGNAEVRPANVAHRARSAFVMLGEVRQIATLPTSVYHKAPTPRKQYLHNIDSKSKTNESKTTMKRNVSVKVFATKAGDLTERTEEPVFRRERYQVDETEIDIVSLKHEYLPRVM